MSVWIVSGILVISLYLLITEKFTVDVTAIGIIVALMLSRVLTPLEAVAGFANPAVITVAAMFLISRGMIRTGAVGFIAQKVIEYSKGNTRLAMIYVLLVVAGASAFINNTPVVVLFIPIILSLSCEYDLSPSKFLIPVSYASILAGTCTLIGTSTNIIVSDLSAMYGYGELGMFELAAAGLPIACLGIAFLYLFSARMMPSHGAPTCELEDREDRLYLAEFAVPAASPLIGADPIAYLAEKYPTLQVFEVVRAFHILRPANQSVKIAGDDLMLVKGSANDLVAILKDQIVELPHTVENLNFSVDDDHSLIVEFIVPPQSSLLGERLIDTDLRYDPDIHIIAVKRRNLHYSSQKIQNTRIMVGDIILVRCTRAKLDRVRAGGDFIILEDVHHQIVHKDKARRALLIFSGVIIAATSGFADIMVCALAGVLAMIFSRCLQIQHAYRAIQGEVLILIVGTIALGTAMEKTGTTRLYAEAFLGLFHGASPQVVLAGMILLTSVSTQMLSNNATAVLIVPIAISTAVAMGVDPKPFIVGVCFGASACFATPMGYQTNLLVYAPGSYRFTDYLKLGIPLNLLVILMGSILIPWFWSF